MKLYLTIGLLLLLGPWTALAVTPGDTALRLRMEALTLADAGQTAEAILRLGEAHVIAKDVNEPYARANALRYVGEAYCTLHDTQACSQAFHDAMQAALSTPLWYRRLSAIIGVVELQKSAGDSDGARLNALYAISTGLFETIAAQGNAGETGRFIMSLDGLMNTEDLSQIRARIEATRAAEFQRKALHALDTIHPRPDSSDSKPF